VARAGTERKIRGVEQEYPVTAKASFSPSLLVNAAIQGLKRRRFSREIAWDLQMEVSQELHESKISSSFGENGSRIYNDMGHLEIATPSYNTPFDAVAYDKAADLYAFLAAREASIALKKSVTVHKNNVANFFTSGDRSVRKGQERRIRTNTYATHGNIITTRAACKEWRMVERALIPWVVTRILFTGSGDVVSGELVGAEGVKFVISPRAMFVVQPSSLSTTAMRGILNTRDQPHAAKHYWRLHDIHYEALRSEYALFLRDISHALVIRAFESGFLADAPELEDPVGAFKHLAQDTQDCTWRICLKNGERTDAVAILRYYVEAIERLREAAGEDWSSWDDLGLNALDALVNDLDARHLERYVDGLDWVTKLALLVNYDPKGPAEGMSICNQFALLDESTLSYLPDEHIGPTSASECLYNPSESLAFARARLPAVDWAALPERVVHAAAHAPEQTRDYFKTELLKRYGTRVRAASWSTILLDRAKIALDEPFMLCKEEIGAAMEQSTTLEELLAAAHELYPRNVSL